LVLARAIIVGCSVLLGGCASIFEGTTQQIAVNTTPAGARCTFWKNGSLVGDVGSTPGTLSIRKSRDDLFIVCDKPGYTSATFVNKSGLAMATFANILTAGLAWAVDSSRGADNKYQGEVNMALVPVDPSVPASYPRAPAAPRPSALGAATAGTVRTNAPGPAPASPAPVAAPPASQIECAASDGSRIRVTGSGCPAGWAAVQ
jgi:hypothetical protein